MPNEDVFEFEISTKRNGMSESDFNQKIKQNRIKMQINWSDWTRLLAIKLEMLC